MRLIDAYALQKLFNEVSTGLLGKATFDLIVAEVIADAPTIDAEPVRHGHWVKHPVYFEVDICSVCGSGCSRRFIKGRAVTEYGYPRCPHCGAKMDAADTDVPTREEGEA